MITKETLKRIVMLGYLTEEMLDQLLPVTELLRFQETEYVFRQQDRAGRFYMLLQGKILLEQRITPYITVSLSAVKPGYAFGWSAFLDDETYTTDALCTEASQVLSIRSDRLRALFEKDPSLGYRMSARLLRVIKKRLDIRTEQLVKAIQHHPDIGPLL